MLFTGVRGETVWKFGIALSSGCHLWVKGCEEALFGRLQRSDEDDRDPLQLFSKQFRKMNSRKFGCRILHRFLSQSRENRRRAPPMRRRVPRAHHPSTREPSEASGEDRRPWWFWRLTVFGYSNTRVRK